MISCKREYVNSTELPVHYKIYLLKFWETVKIHFTFIGSVLFYKLYSRFSFSLPTELVRKKAQIRGLCFGRSQKDCVLSAMNTLMRRIKQNYKAKYRCCGCKYFETEIDSNGATEPCNPFMNTLWIAKTHVCMICVFVKVSQLLCVFWGEKFRVELWSYTCLRRWEKWKIIDDVLGNSFSRVIIQ